MTQLLLSDSRIKQTHRRKKKKHQTMMDQIKSNQQTGESGMSGNGCGSEIGKKEVCLCMYERMGSVILFVWSEKSVPFKR